MPYIYKITNMVNNKIYIGKTLNSIEKRWKEHKNEYQKERVEKRPLYSAMKKYGIDNFEISLVEECTEDNFSEREKYWIEFYGSFKYGYNATLGGDGTRYADYDLIYSLWKQDKTVLDIHKITTYDESTIRRALECYKVSSEERKKRANLKKRKMIAQLDKNTEQIIRIFPLTEEANRFLNKQSSGHISAVCKGKRQTAYGYKWKYLDN